VNISQPKLRSEKFDDNNNNKFTHIIQNCYCISIHPRQAKKFIPKSLVFIICGCQYKPSQLRNGLESDTIENVRSQIGQLLYLLHSWLV
jgi:hypothetical protein